MTWSPLAFAQEGFLLLVTTRILQIQHINASQSGEGTGEAMQVAEQPSAHTVPMSRVGFAERARGHLMGGVTPGPKTLWQRFSGAPCPPSPSVQSPWGASNTPQRGRAP